MCAVCIFSINQHCFDGERGMLIKQSKKYCKCSKTFGRDCTYHERILKEQKAKICLCGEG